MTIPPDACTRDDESASSIVEERWRKGRGRTAYMSTCVPVSWRPIADMTTRARTKRYVVIPQLSANWVVRLKVRRPRREENATEEERMRRVPS